ncbi:lanthionine synthetase LanC family protein [Sphingomonas sp.]|uniref:lanthionine synthetase LanC family protein n=1 Tax=Sphingomonas sp. TaxID=28214 RepID=UPI003D6D3FF6
MTSDAGQRIDAALRIGNLLCADALWWDGRCTFTTDDVDPIAAGWQIVHRTCGGDLYTGTAGIALFLARLAALTGDRVIARTAAGTLAHALAEADTPGMEGRSALYTGRLGIAVVAAMAGEWLGRADFTAASARLVTSIETSAIAGFSGGDLMAGLSGGIAGALILARRLADDRLLAWASQLGDALIAEAHRSPSGWHWPTPKELIGLCGLSHGAAGIAWAFAELARATGEQRFAQAAANAVIHEQHWFDADAGNWPDLSPDSCDSAGRRSFSLSWCHGAPGIALTRLRLWELTGNDQLREQARVAIATTAADLRASLEQGIGNYSLCHGLAGNAEALIEAGPSFETGDLAASVAMAGIDRFGADPRSWPAGVDSGDTTSPTLMLGLAGTGYFLLRIDDAAGTPSILLPDAGVSPACPTVPSLVEAFADKSARSG